MRAYMMLAMLFACLVCLVSSDGQMSWEEYKRKFEKHYSDPKEDAMRKELFLKSMAEAEEHNAKAAPGTSEWGPNMFSDYTDAEWERKNGFRVTPEDIARAQARPKFDWDRFLKYTSPNLAHGLFHPSLGPGFRRSSKNRMFASKGTTKKPLSTRMSWEEYKRKFNKHYSDPKEDAKREKLFQKAIALAEEINAKVPPGALKVGPNEFSDYTDEERLRLFGLSNYTPQRFGASTTSVPDEGDDEELPKKPVAPAPISWEEYKRRFKKHYKDPKEDAKRKKLFLKEMAMIEERNAEAVKIPGHATFVPNRFSDYTEKEKLFSSGHNPFG